MCLTLSQDQPKGPLSWAFVRGPKGRALTRAASAPRPGVGPPRSRLLATARTLIVLPVLPRCLVKAAEAGHLGSSHRLSARMPRTLDLWLSVRVGGPPRASAVAGLQGRRRPAARAVGHVPLPHVKAAAGVRWALLVGQPRRGGAVAAGLGAGQRPPAPPIERGVHGRCWAWSLWSLPVVVALSCADGIGGRCWEGLVDAFAQKVVVVAVVVAHHGSSGLSVTAK